MTGRTVNTLDGHEHAVLPDHLHLLLGVHLSDQEVELTLAHYQEVLPPYGHRHGGEFHLTHEHLALPIQTEQVNVLHCTDYYNLMESSDNWLTHLATLPSIQYWQGNPHNDLTHGQLLFQKEATRLVLAYPVKNDLSVFEVGALVNAQLSSIQRLSVLKLSFPNHYAVLV